MDVLSQSVQSRIASVLPGAGGRSSADNHAWRLTIGICLMLLGIAAICLCTVIAIAVEILVGWVLLFAALAQTMHAIGTGNWRAFLPAILYAMVYFLAGMMMLTFPIGGVLTLTLLLAAFFIVAGLFKIGLSMQLRPARNWGWMTLSGCMAILLGVLIWAQWPSTARWAIGLLVGIDMMLTGWSMIMVALAARSVARLKDRS
jgi:uncharacterized membrane protein HdeD (DUF308 family)